jgi:hypothetical protein
MIAEHQRMMRTGYMIPLSMDWMFYPTGVERTLLYTVKNTDPLTGEEVEESREIPNPVLEAGAANRRFKITNHEEWIAQMIRLGAVKERRSDNG